MPPLLEVKALHTEFRTGAGLVRAGLGIFYSSRKCQPDDARTTAQFRWSIKLGIFQLQLQRLTIKAQCQLSLQCAVVGRRFSAGYPLIVVPVNVLEHFGSNFHTGL
jgi:hypothetical protein